VEPARTRLDQRVETTIGNLLRIGVSLSAGIVLFGAAVYLWRHGQSRAAYGSFRDEFPDLRTVGGVLRSVASFSGRGIIQLGILVLIATPVARVAFSIWGFSVGRDKTYVVVATLVLCGLFYGLFGSALGIQ
jgi:uncharacterized membrane protein